MSGSSPSAIAPSVLAPVQAPATTSTTTAQSNVAGEPSREDIELAQQLVYHASGKHVGSREQAHTQSLREPLSPADGEIAPSDEVQGVVAGVTEPRPSPFSRPNPSDQQSSQTQRSNSGAPVGAQACRQVLSLFQALPLLTCSPVIVEPQRRHYGGAHQMERLSVTLAVFTSKLGTRCVQPISRELSKDVHLHMTMQTGL